MHRTLRHCVGLALFLFAWLALDQAAARTQPPLSPGVIPRLERATWVRDAHTKRSARAVYVFVDPECGYCNQLWKSIQSTSAPGAEVRYILVGIITPASAAKAAAILESADPSATLAKHEAHFADGGIPPVTKISGATHETLSLNASLMEALGIPATPAIVYRNGKGETHLFLGLPSADELKEILSPTSS